MKQVLVQSSTVAHALEVGSEALAMIGCQHQNRVIRMTPAECFPKSSYLLIDGSHASFVEIGDKCDVFSVRSEKVLENMDLWGAQVRRPHSSS